MKRYHSYDGKLTETIPHSPGSPHRVDCGSPVTVGGGYQVGENSSTCSSPPTVSGCCQVGGGYSSCGSPHAARQPSPKAGAGGRRSNPLLASGRRVRSPTLLYPLAASPSASPSGMRTSFSLPAGVPASSQAFSPRPLTGAGLSLQALRGQYLSDSGNLVEIDSEGLVSKGDDILQLFDDGDTISLRSAGGCKTLYRLRCREPSGALLMDSTDCFGDENGVATANGFAAAAASGSRSPGSQDTKPQVRWKPINASAAPALARPPSTPEFGEDAESFGVEVDVLEAVLESGEGSAATKGFVFEMDVLESVLEGRRATTPGPRGMHSPLHRCSTPRVSKTSFSPRVPTGTLSARLPSAGLGSRLGRQRGSWPHSAEPRRQESAPAIQGGASRERLRQSPTPGRQRSNSVMQTRPRLGVAAGTGDPGLYGKNFDKNSMRLRNGSAFVGALARWRSRRPHLPSMPARRLLPGMCAVYIRKRPMFDKDLRRCDFDVLTVVDESEIVHHMCTFDKSMVTPVILHTAFPFDAVFDADASNEDIYQRVGKPLLENVLRGELSTLFVFGQTGSGKTYTMRAIEHLTANELFERLDANAEVSIAYFELAGRKALDLLTETKAEIRVREEEDGCFRPHDHEEAVVTSAAELVELMREAGERRATDATAVNAASSRSHAVCRISIMRERRVSGRLLLVDCAGSERSRDSLYLKGSNVKESAEINSSLFALKDCIRSRQAAIHRMGGVPQDAFPLRLPGVRATPLTKVLAESLVSATAQLAAIATLSPNATDAEHTIDTLKAVYTLSGRGEPRLSEVREVLE